jgi:GTP 3',8-cyclase
VIRDTLDRPLRNLRLSVTDRCNLRCQYCMPEEEYVWLPRNDVLSFEEMAQLVDVFTDLGVDKVRLTGGEPLLRRDLDQLVRLLAGNPRLRDLALTTNGVLLAEQGAALRAAGLHRVTVSLDTLRADRFRLLTRRDTHARVLEGIASVGQGGWPGLKLDTVVMRGVNDDELADLVEYAGSVGAEVRFIEYMDVGGATNWSMERPPTASGCPTAACSGSSPRPPSPSVAPAIAAASPPTACGTSASTRPGGWTCAEPCGVGPRATSCCA